MAQSRNAPGIPSVPDPGGLGYPVNTLYQTPTSPALAPAIQPVPAAQAAPGSSSVQRGGSSLPLNAPRAQAVGAPAQWAASASSSFPTVGTVPDPGASSFPLHQSRAIGMPADTATPGGGDPSAMGGYVPGPTSPSALWSQFNPNGNPNPGALSGGAVGSAPAYLPGQTGISQVSPEKNPNPGGL